MSQSDPDPRRSHASTKESAVGFIGLGNMGEPMAANLLAAGFDLVVYDRDPDRASALVVAGARSVDSLTQLVADTILFSLPGPKQVDEVLTGPDGLIHRLEPGACLVNLSTLSLQCVLELDRSARAAGVLLVDAPVTGAADGARAGTLSLMVGGEDAAVARVRPLLDAISASVHHLGGVGAGTAAKLITNGLWFTHVVALADALALAVRSGIEPTRFGDLVVDSAGASWVAEHDLENLLRGDDDTSFTLALCCKDLELIRELTGDLGIATQLGSTVRERFAEALDRFGPEAGELAVARLVEEESGVSIRSVA